MAEKKNSSKIWQKILIVFGVIFLFLILLIVIIGIYLSVKKPLGLEIADIPGAILAPTEVTESTYDHPLLSEDQEVFLENIGVNTESIPAAITEEQQACAVEKLGQKRVDEILSGAEFKTTDYIKAGSCF